MATIKHKVWKKLTAGSAPVLQKLDPATADITQISRLGSQTDEELIRIVPYGTEINTQAMLEVVSDLVDNDYKINQEIIASNEIISEGVFDINKSELTTAQETELATYVATLAGSGTLTPTEQTQYDYLIKLKYGYRFEVDYTEVAPADIDITVGPGKFKVNEEVESSVYFVNEVTEFEPDEVPYDDYYRLDVIEAVFRDDDNDTPYLQYTNGDPETTPSPGHVFIDRVLTETDGTFPLWSVLLKRTSGTTEIVRITQVFDWVGLRALLELTNMEPHVLTNATLSKDYYQVHGWKEIALRNYNGVPLTVDYGEGSTVTELDYTSGAPYYDINTQDDTRLPSTIEGVANNYEDLYRGSLQNFPFQVDETYNSYLSIEEVEFRQFSVGIKEYEGTVLEADREGLELHIFEADQFATDGNLREFEVVTANYDLASGDIDGSPALPASSVAFQIDTDTDDITQVYQGPDTYVADATGPVAGDFVMVTYGKGLYQISELLAIYSKDGTDQDVLVTKPFTILLDDDGGYSNPPRISIFKTSTEALVGNEIRDEVGVTTAWYDALESTDQLDVDDQYFDSDHTGIMRMEWESSGGDPDVKSSYNASGSDIFGTGYKQIDFGAKLDLSLNKWYFIKCRVYQKPEPFDVYNDSGRPQVVYPDPLHASVDTWDDFTGYYKTKYYKNFGKYADVNAESLRYIKISDEYGDIEDATYTARIADGLPGYWKCVATNLDDEVIAEPPAASSGVGVCYVDVARGKFMFYNGEEPTDVKITCVIDNVLHGRSDTEDMLHIESSTETVTLSAKLADMNRDIETLLTTISASKVMDYRGAHNKIYKNASQEYNILHNDITNLGTDVYVAYDDSTEVENEIIEQRYPVSRLYNGVTDGWSLAHAMNYIGAVSQVPTVNLFDNSVISNSLLDVFEVSIADETTGEVDESTDDKISFDISPPTYLGSEIAAKRFGFRLSDYNANIVEDLGFGSGATTNEWDDGLYLAIHDDTNTSLVTSADGIHWIDAKGNHPIIGPSGFTGTDVPGFASASYEIDITVDGTLQSGVSFAIAITDDWDTICLAMQTALRALTSGTETIGLQDTGAGNNFIVVESGTTGSSSAILLATTTGGGTDFVTALTALGGYGAYAIGTPVDGSDDDGATDYALFIPKTRVEAIYREFNRKGVAVDTAGYQDMEFAGGTVSGQTTNLLAGNQYYFKVNAAEYDIQPSVNNPTIAEVIVLINAEITGVTCSFMDAEGGPVMRFEHDTVGAGNDIALTDGTTGTNLFEITGGSDPIDSFSAKATDVDGKDGYLTDEESQDKMWIYFDINDELVFTTDSYHFHLFTKYKTSSTTTPNIVKYNYGKWLQEETSDSYLNDLLIAKKFFFRPLKYSGGGTYTGGYNDELYIPKLIDIEEKDVFPTIDGGGTVVTFTGDTTTDSAIITNVTADMTSWSTEDEVYIWSADEILSANAIVNSFDDGANTVTMSMNANKSRQSVSFSMVFSEDHMDWSLTVTADRYNISPDMKKLDIMPGIFSTQTDWDNWKYYDYVGIDPASGRIKMPSTFYWPSLTFGATTTTGSATVTGITDTSVLRKGMDITGSNIPATTIDDIIDGTSIFLSDVATGTGADTITGTREYDFDTDLIFSECYIRWPFSSIYTESFGDADDPGVSLHDRRFENLRTSNELVTITDDDWERARLSARSVAVEWMTDKNYKVNDIVAYGFKLYKCKADHTSNRGVFITDVAYWTAISGGGGTVYDVNIDDFQLDDAAYIGKDWYDLTVGDIVRFNQDTEVNEGNPDFGWLRAIADDVTHLAQGMVMGVSDNENFIVISAGMAEGIVGTTGPYSATILDDAGQPLIPNTWYYASDTVKGGITFDKPAIAQTVLYTLGPTNVSFDPGVDLYDGEVISCIVDIDDMNVGSITQTEVFIISTPGQTTVPLLNVPVGPEYCDVSINGILQHEGWSLSGVNINFDTSLEVGQSVRVKYGMITESQPGAVVLEQEITSTDQSGVGSGQAIFNFSGLQETPLSQEYCMVTISGLIQASTAYDLAAKVVTFASPVPAGLTVAIKIFYNLNITAPATASIKDYMFGEVEMLRNVELIYNHTIPIGDRRLSVGWVEIVSGETVELSNYSVWAII